MTYSRTRTEAVAPTVGETVFYMPPLEDNLPGPMAGIITGLHDRDNVPLGEGMVWLTIFPPGRLPGYSREPVPYDPTGRGHSWTRPVGRT